MRQIVEGKNYSIISDCGRSRIPERFRDLAFSKIITKIIGKEPFVSIVFIRESKMKRLNKKYRGKDTSTDVLSFKSDSAPEILFSLNDVRRKARKFEVEAGEYLSYLLIHALLHLKGHSHSSKMDRQEKKFCKFFRVKYPHF